MGISLGFQCAALEFARNVAGLTDANSSEFAAQTPHPVISLMENIKPTGTMRIGSLETVLKTNTKIKLAYGEKTIHERHRHRYELNTEYQKTLEDNGLVISGTTADGTLADCLELPNLDFFIACQYHPEFKSRPETPHPLFKGLLKATLKQKKSKK